MVIGIIGAMEEEVESLLKDMQDYKETNKAGMVFYAGGLCERSRIKRINVWVDIALHWFEFKPR